MAACGEWPSECLMAAAASGLPRGNGAAQKILVSPDVGEFGWLLLCLIDCCVLHCFPPALDRGRRLAALHPVAVHGGRRLAASHPGSGRPRPTLGGFTPR